MTFLGDRAADFRFLVRDGAGQFTRSFDAVLADAGIEAVKVPPQSPKANAYAERFVLTAWAEVTDRMLIFGQRHLQTILAENEARYNGRRHHRSCHLRLGQITLPRTCPGSASSTGPFWAASSTTTSGRHRSPAQDRWPSSGTPQAGSRPGVSWSPHAFLTVRVFEVEDCEKSALPWYEATMTCLPRLIVFWDEGEQLPVLLFSFIVHKVVWPTAMMTTPRGAPEYCGMTVTLTLSDRSLP